MDLQSSFRNCWGGGEKKDTNEEPPYIYTYIYMYIYIDICIYIIYIYIYIFYVLH